MMFRYSILMLVAVAMVGCTTSVSRPCPAFGTPMAEQWSTGLNVGDVINYVSKTGATAALELRSREDSEAYVGSTNNGAEVVECGTDSFRQYVFENSDVALQVRINETRLEDLADNTGQLFQLRITPESPIGEFVAPGYSFGFSLAEQARPQYTSEFQLEGELETRFIENLQIGSNTYPYAVERRYVDLTRITNAVTDPNSLAGIKRVIVAEGRWIGSVRVAKQRNLQPDFNNLS